MNTLVVRLPNHLGDACMALPALELLAANGCALTLAGRGWSAQLFEAYAWPTITLPGPMRAQVRMMRAAPSAGAPALLLTNSFSSALAFRLAGHASTGYARGGRSWLLARAVAVTPGDHMVVYYHRLASQLVSARNEVASSLSLRLSHAARERAGAILKDAGVAPGYCVLCPLAIGRHRGQIKAWNGFTRLAAELRARGLAVVTMPGPGETAAARAVLPEATLLPESDLGTFGAVLAGARFVVANDSGAGHLAAAVGAPLISVFGVTEVEQTRPWGPQVRIVGGAHGWPDYAEVIAAVDAVAPARSP